MSHRNANVDGLQVKIVGWGGLFESKAHNDPKSDSTCITTHEGPLKYQFKHCNMESISVSKATINSIS